MKRFLNRHGGTAKQETPDGGAGLFGSLTINAFWSQNTDFASSNVSPCLRHSHRLSQIPFEGEFVHVHEAIQNIAEIFKK
jgi:hypothetical protein